MGRWRGSARRNSAKEGPVFSRERRVLAAEIPALPQWEPEKVGSVGKRSGDGNYESGLEVRLGYLDSGDSIFGGCSCGYISTHSKWRTRI